MNFYSFHIGDYASATRHLSWDEDAAYRRLLDVYYTNEKPLPLDERRLFRLVMAQTEPQREAVRIVLAEFFDQGDEGWTNKRADCELELMRDKREKQREKAHKRWAKPNPVSGNAADMPQHTSEHATASIDDADAMPPIPIPIPIPKDKRKSASRSPSIPDGVSEQVWSDWQALRKAKRAPVTATVIEDARREAGKAGISLDDFLTIWCARGSQGLRAEWINPRDRPSSAQQSQEPAWRTEQRERNVAFLGPAAAARRIVNPNTIDAENTDGTSGLLA